MNQKGNEMSEEMEETTIKGDFSQSQILNALKGSLDPIFAYLEDKLAEGDGKFLDIRVAVRGGKISMSYGVNDIPEGAEL